MTFYRRGANHARLIRLRKRRAKFRPSGGGAPDKAKDAQENALCARIRAGAR